MTTSNKPKADDKIIVNEYFNNIEGWKCTFAVLPEVFRFYAGNNKFVDIPRDGKEWPNSTIMSSLSSPIAYEDKCGKSSNDEGCYKSEKLSWKEFCNRYKTSTYYL